MFEFDSHWNKEVIEECMPILMRPSRKRLVRMYLISIVVILGVGVVTQITSGENDWNTTVMVALLMSVFAAYLYRKVGVKELLVLMDQMEKKYQTDHLERHVVLKDGVLVRQDGAGNTELQVADIDFVDVAKQYIVIMFKTGQCITCKIDTITGGTAEEFLAALKK